MAGWIKFFNDNCRETGFDSDIEKGLSSWSRGRLKDLFKVWLFDERRAGILSLPSTEWHQFDRFSVPLSVGTHEPIRTHRVVQALITKEHEGFYLSVRRLDDVFVDIQFSEDEGIEIKNLAGKWLTLVMTEGSIISLVTQKGSYR